MGVRRSPDQHGHAPVTEEHCASAHLAALLVAVADVADDETAVRRTVEHVAAALRTDVAAVIADGQVRCALGAALSAEHVPEMTRGSAERLEVSGVGPCHVTTAACGADTGARLLVARADTAFDQHEQHLVQAMAQVLGLARGARRVVDGQRTSHALPAAGAAGSADLLASLQERQTLLERLSRIQRSISSRQPLRDVLEAIVVGAAELLGEDVVGLRLVDPQDPSYTVLASSIGIPDHLVAESQRQPVGQGVGGRAIVENRLVHTADYGSVDRPLPGFVADGIRAVMAAPVRQGARAVGSLAAATRRPRADYSASEQEALTAFAEHVSLALNDAQAVEALHEAVERATHASLHDGLTGLPNRARFLDRLDAATAHSAACGNAPFSLLFVDIDDFKLVNDSLGHLVGDRLLTAAAGRVRGTVRARDMVARLGGDEFAVLLDDGDDRDAVLAAQRVLATLAAPFALPNGQTVHVTASIGVVTSRGADESAEELLRDADVAMYRAKADGKHRCVVFERAMRDRLQARTELESDLRRALSRDQFVVHYQPVVDAEQGTVVSLEALLRWEHPRHGVVAPADFIPLAEDTGLIVQIGRFVLREACRQTAAWRRTPELAGVAVSVNLSPRQLQEPSLLDDVAGALRSSALPAHALVLEITESLLVRDVEIAAQRLEKLKSLGVRLAVDDFGTGYSSLSYLSRLPVDILKVDKAFVAGIADGTSAGKLAWAVLALASSLDLETVAEGVETPEQAEALLAQGCTRLQGFLYSRAVPGPVLPGTAAALRDRMTMAATALTAVPRARSATRRSVVPG